MDSLKAAGSLIHVVCSIYRYHYNFLISDLDEVVKVGYTVI